MSIWPSATWPGSAASVPTTVTNFMRSAGLTFERSSNVCLSVASSLRRRTTISWASVLRLRNVRTVPGVGSIGGFWNPPSTAYTCTVRDAGEAAAAEADADGLATGDAAAEAEAEADGLSMPVDGMAEAAGE